MKERKGKERERASCDARWGAKTSKKKSAVDVVTRSLVDEKKTDSAAVDPRLKREKKMEQSERPIRGD